MILHAGGPQGRRGLPGPSASCPGPLNARPRVCQAAHPGKAHVPTSSSPVEDTSRRPTNPPQRVAVAFGESGADTVGILSLEDRVWELYCHQHTDSVLHVTSLGQQGQYLSCGKDRALKLWSSAGECLKTMRHSCAVNASALLKGENSGCAATACDDSTVRVWRLETGSCLAVLRGHQDKVLSYGSSDHFLRH